MTKVKFNPYNKVAEFIRTFGASLDVRLWDKLVQEETNELIDAMVADDKLNGLKELVDLMYVITGAAIVEPDNIAALLSEDENHDFDMTTEGAEEAISVAIERWGFKPEVIAEAFTRVHASNMSKLGPDGKPIKREDGKIMKGPNYREPDLSDLV